MADSPLTYYAAPAGRRFLARQSGWLLLTAVALLATFGATDLDLRLERPFFDTARALFPLTNDWLLKTVLHDAARTASAIGALTLLLATGTSWSVGRAYRLHTYRYELAFVSTAALAAAAVVGTLKHYSAHACPWDLAGFGGSAPYSHLFTALAPPLTSVGCLPAAHPLTGYAWLCVGLVLYPVARSRAHAAWLAAGTLGTVLGVVQMARGAHFASHVLWSAWTTWAVELALLAVWAVAAHRSSVADTTRRERIRVGPEARTLQQ